MIDIDTKQAEQAERDLKLFREKAMPFAIRGTLNGQAFEGMKLARANTRDNMTLRNQWTERSIQAERATGVLQADEHDDIVFDPERVADAQALALQTRQLQNLLAERIEVSVLCEQAPAPNNMIPALVDAFHDGRGAVTS